MARPLLFALAVVGAVLALALLEHGSEGPGPGVLAAAPAPDPGESAPRPGSLVDCLASTTPAENPGPLPPMTPRGVEVVAGQVEELRELSSDEEVDVTFLSGDAMRREIGRLIDEDADVPRLRRAGYALELLGAIPPGTDVLELSRQALDAQVLGLYIPDTRELLVVRAGDPGAGETITLAHELEHALADEVLGLPLPESVRPGEGDRDLAAQALVEGDATLLMSQYALRHISAEDQLDLLDDPSISGGQKGLARLPHFLRAGLLFPYEEGLDYVCELYSEGGWEAVDDAYANPPASTVELLIPGTEPIELTDPPPLTGLTRPWRRTLTEAIGAAELSWLFEAPGDDRGAAIPDPVGSAADWRGGTIELWERGGERAVGVALAQTPEGSLCEAIVAWFAAANPGAELSREGTTTTLRGGRTTAFLTCEGQTIRLGISSDPSAAERLGG